MNGPRVQFRARGGNPINSEYEVWGLEGRSCRVRIFDDGRVEAPGREEAGLTREDCVGAIKRFERAKLDADIARYREKAERDRYYRDILNELLAERTRRFTCPECGGSDTVRLLSHKDGWPDGPAGVCGNKFHEHGVFWARQKSEE